MPVRSDLLQHVTIASPCHERWEDMKGDAEVRFCARCEQNVYDLSAMTAADAEALLASRTDRLCVRLYRRADGTVLTRDCPDRPRRRRQRRVAAGIAALFAGGLGAAAAARWFGGPEARPPHATMGAVSPLPPPVVEATDEPTVRATMGEAMVEPAEMGQRAR